jgi:hypothetical protein
MGLGKVSAGKKRISKGEEQRESYLRPLLLAYLYSTTDLGGQLEKLTD